MDLKTRPPAHATQELYPHMEVLGRSVMCTVSALEMVRERATRMLAEKGLSPLRPDRWFPLDPLLQVLQDIQEQIGPSTVRSIGRKLPEMASFPADPGTLEEGLRAIDVAYRKEHRGTGNIGAYRFELVGRRAGQLVSDTPYPCDLDLGIIEAISDRCRPRDALWVRIDHDPATCRRRGDLACTYHIRW